MIIIKTQDQINTMREGGKIHAEILRKLADMVKPGVTATELDAYAEQLVREAGAEPAFLGYSPDKHHPPYPATLCVSINDTVVHGIPTEHMVLKEGDIVSIDLGVKNGGLFTDAAITVPVGTISQEAQQLIYDTKEAMHLGIEQARAGNRIGDIGHAIDSFNNKRYGNVRELAGHGVGVAIHEDPYVPNYGKKGTGEVLKPGMIIAIEPMFNLGTANVLFDDDNYSVLTKDGAYSAHFEHTVLITDGDPEILTEL